jgi:hypothetical protein
MTVTGGMMKQGVISAVLILLVVCTQAVYAEAEGEDSANDVVKTSAGHLGGFLGQLSTAEVIPLGAIDLGAHVGFYDDANALFGQFRMGVVRYCEWEIKSGVLDTEGGSDPHLMIGSAFKYHFYDRRQDAAPDMALSALIEYYGLDRDGSAWIFGTGLIGSYPFRLSNNSDLTPYGRLSLRIERLSVGNDRDSDFDIGLNIGTQYAPTHRFQLYGELQLDDQFGFIGGINFAVY